MEPVIGLDFLPLRRALEAMESNPTTQVCRCILGLVDRNDLWVCLELTSDVIGTDALEKIIDSVHKALSELLPLCSAKRILELFEDHIHLRRDDSSFAILQEHLKHEVLSRLMSEQHFGILH